MAHILFVAYLLSTESTVICIRKICQNCFCQQFVLWPSLDISLKWLFCLRKPRNKTSVLQIVILPSHEILFRQFGQKINKVSSWLSWDYLLADLGHQSRDNVEGTVGECILKSHFELDCRSNVSRVFYVS